MLLGHVFRSHNITEKVTVELCQKMWDQFKQTNTLHLTAVSFKVAESDQAFNVFNVVR